MQYGKYIQQLNKYSPCSAVGTAENQIFRSHATQIDEKIDDLDIYGNRFSNLNKYNPYKKGTPEEEEKLCRTPEEEEKLCRNSQCNLT